jgi:nucleoside-diphosphate-sugar epimerase
VTRVLVVGSAGYVGRRLMLALARRPDVQSVGADIRTGPGFADLRVDLAFPAQSYAAVLAAKPDVVINLAYLLAASCEADPQRAVETNTAGVNGLFEACHRLGVPRVVYASSGSVYGDQSIYGDRDVGEEEPLPPPRTLYQLMKQFNEVMAAHYNKRSTTRFIGLRLSSPHGRGKTADPFDALVRAAASGERSVALPFPSQRPLAFNYVDDSAELCVKVALAPSLRWDLYNQGGEPLTMQKLAQIATDQAGVRATFDENATKGTFMERISSKRLEDELGLTRRPAAEWFAQELAESRSPRPVA